SSSRDLPALPSFPTRRSSDLHCRVEHLFNVGPGSFNPPPKVDSAIVRLTPHAQLPHQAQDVRALDRIVREAFNQRRKTLRNTLRSEEHTSELQSRENLVCRLL